MALRIVSLVERLEPALCDACGQLGRERKASHVIRVTVWHGNIGSPTSWKACEEHADEWEANHPNGTLYREPAHGGTRDGAR